MIKLAVVLALTGVVRSAAAQSGSQEIGGSATRINDLVHTRLELRFDYAHSYAYGREEITLRPHFYPTDSLTLDARQMSISGVDILDGGKAIPAKFGYDGWKLRIRLPRLYRQTETYRVQIVYIAKPAEATVPNDQRGLYFINPTGADPHKPTQIWTDSEAEKVSMWCPTIDHPNQRCTVEMLLTVPDKYLTLSNGRLAQQVHHGDGTRTDDWRMSLPHAPYLFFFAVGNWSVARDNYKGKELSYYVDPAFASTARGVFGETPAMMAFFERVTGVPFPWVKYSQVVVHDLTSTAMENTTATAHGVDAEQDARELVDGNRWENNIAHELFHQWCGDYVTCESWSNLSLNESFARFSEFLWQRWRHGDDAAMDEWTGQLEGYLRNPDNAGKALVRTHFANPDDVFDDISYNKGALVLNMLRVYLGDSTFCKGLQLYLRTNAFKSVEVHQLRLAMEEVSGRDLNWFFDEWFFGAGHPKVTVDYRYDPGAGMMRVLLVQTQERPFTAPFYIDVYTKDGKKRYPVWMRQAADTFSFPCAGRPLLVNVDAEKLLLWDKTDHKTPAELAYQYDHAGNYADRREAVQWALQHADDPMALGLIRKGLKDRYAGVRQIAVLGLVRAKTPVKLAVEPLVADLAVHDANALVRRFAIRLLPDYGLAYRQALLSELEDSSYSAAGEALNALGRIDSVAALAEARKRVALPSRGTLAEEIVGTLAQYGSEADFDVLLDRFTQLSFKPRISRKFAGYLGRVRDASVVKKGVDALVEFRRTSPGFFTPVINDNLREVLARKVADGLTGQAEYVRAQLAEAGAGR